jgi:hypothetical protein
VLSLALSSDGKRLFSGSNDQTIKVWDLEKGKEALTLHGHAAEVSSLALSSDGKRLFSGSGDQTIMRGARDIQDYFRQPTKIILYVPGYPPPRFLTATARAGLASAPAKPMTFASAGQEDARG